MRQEERPSLTRAVIWIADKPYAQPQAVHAHSLTCHTYEDGWVSSQGMARVTVTRIGQKPIIEWLMGLRCFTVLCAQACPLCGAKQAAGAQTLLKYDILVSEKLPHLSLIWAKWRCHDESYSRIN